MRLVCLLFVCCLVGCNKNNYSNSQFFGTWQSDSLYIDTNLTTGTPLTTHFNIETWVFNSNLDFFLKNNYQAYDLADNLVFDTTFDNLIGSFNVISSSSIEINSNYISNQISYFPNDTLLDYQINTDSLFLFNKWYTKQ
jgi:hypothetical protein